MAPSKMRCVESRFLRASLSALRPLHAPYRAVPELTCSFAEALERQHRVIMVEDGFRQLQWGMRSLYVCVYECLHIVQLGGELRRCADVCVEPSLYQLDLIAEMDGGSAKGGRVEGSFFDHHGAGLWSAGVVCTCSIPTYISASGFSTGCSAGCSAVSSAMLSGTMLKQKGIYRNEEDYVCVIYNMLNAQEGNRRVLPLLFQ
jgi:hypothetical protein